MKDTILVVDDDSSIRYSLTRMFSGKGLQVFSARNSKEALQLIERERPTLILVDVRMPGMDGLGLLKEMKRLDPRSIAIVMTAFGTTETAIEAMKLGAFDYILKPFDIPKMWELIEKALQVSKLMERVVYDQQVNIEDLPAESIIGTSSRMQDVYKLIGQVAQSNLPVLVLGESGTGKELVARAIYHHSKRRTRPFLPVNCAAIPEALLESELFGYERGAFTGAETRRIGKFEQCNGGTLFLDEIGDISLAIQAKLLRVLQEGLFQRLGGLENIRVDVRIIAATNKDIEEAKAQGKFRKDLFYRLNVVPITLPPLRERKEDLPVLVKYFIKRFNSDLNKNIVDLTKEAMEKVSSYSWPGNVRELENSLKRAMVICKGSLIMPDEIAVSQEAIPRLKELSSDSRAKITWLVDQIYEEIVNLQKMENNLDMMSIIEKTLIIKVLQETKGNQVQAASILGMNRNTLRNKLDRYNLRGR